MLITGIVFFLILSLLIFIHEFGHFITAKIIGVNVEEFGLGLPPRVIGRKVKNTIYSLNWLPIGGFVKLSGEDDEEEDVHQVKLPNKSYFWARSKKERAVILTAGVTMNFLLSLLITTYFLIIGVKMPSDKVYIDQVIANTPAAIAGLQVNDRVMEIRSFDSVRNQFTDHKIASTQDLINTVADNKGKILSLIILRKGNLITISVTPRIAYPKDQGPMGIAITDLEFTKYPWYLAPFAALRINVWRAYQMLVGIGTTLATLFAGRVSQLDVAGPIGIAQITGKAVKFGLQSVLEFMSILSLNLAVLNILPFPALDGGRLLFVFAEKILGRRIKAAFERKTHQIGMLFLLFLILLVSINDIARIVRGG